MAVTSSAFRTTGSGSGVVQAEQQRVNATSGPENIFMGGFQAADRPMQQATNRAELSTMVSILASTVKC
jgi:hypothetical protein